MKRILAAVSLVAMAAVIGAVAIALHATSGSAAPVAGLATPTPAGPPANIVFDVAPASGSCAPDTKNLVFVTAHVTDAQGGAVADGTKVRFFVPSLGFPNPVDVFTTGGSASTVVTVMSRIEQLMPIYATAGDAESAIGFLCANPSDPSAPPPSATPPSPPVGP